MTVNELIEALRKTSSDGGDAKVIVVIPGNEWNTTIEIEWVDSRDGGGTVVLTGA